MPAARRKAGKEIEGAMFILDLEGFGYALTFPRTYVIFIFVT
jgi:hypothetical protein